MVSGALFISLLVFLCLNVPVGIAIGMSAVTAILVGGRLSLGFVSQALVNGVDSFPIMAIPLFILAGELMGQGGVSKRILNVCNVFFGRVTGGLAIVTVAVCMFFAAVSGSGPATVAAVGSMVVPTMLQKGYSKSFTLALIACAGSIGVIIPPSIPMVIYGVSTGSSISTLFLAGFLPGIMIGLALMIFCYFYCKKQGWKGDQEAFTWRRAGKALWDGKWALINPVIILGGIYG
ncbi:MAG: TRAP transporter large permease, partial [Treponema sp.]|nr:TRAP transporter large permease [Treponema sp.]